ncbi:MAG: amidohydrolase family protein [Vicinamibacterales bacterium]
MILPWQPAMSFVNARVVTPAGEARSLRFRHAVLAVDEPPRPGDHVVDLEGRYVLPGLINAHDHLELNHYGQLRPRERYGNAREWIADLAAIIRTSPAIVERSRIHLADRLFIGGLKNLLSGVTTVAHHNPLYREFGRQFPVGLIRRFGWAHSLGLEHGAAGAHGEPGGVVHARHAATPPDAPFLVHAAEGVDAEAAAEEQALDARGVLTPNTVLVHGTAITPRRWEPLFGRGVSLAWCPASNQCLFGQTVPMPTLLAQPASAGRVAIGTDSRLTGAADLLDELRVAASTGVGPEPLLAMVTAWAARVLRCGDTGLIQPRMRADLMVIPALGGTAAESLLRCRRSDVALVVRRGTPVVADPSIGAAFTCRKMPTRPVDVDGRIRLIEAGLAHRITTCLLAEPGVTVA